MRKLTRTEIEACGAAMHETMRFHDQLIGTKLLRVTGRRGRSQPPPVLHFEQGAELRTQFDDEGNPGGTEWEITDAEGFRYEPVLVHDLRGQTVTGVGYFLDPENDVRQVIPYVEIAGTFLICVFCQEGGAVICHHRDPDQWDLFCELKPKPRKEPSNACHN